MDTNAFISQAISVRLLRIKKKQYQLASELNIDQLCRVKAGRHHILVIT